MSKRTKRQDLKGVEVYNRRQRDPSRVLTIDAGEWAAAALWVVVDGVVRRPSIFRVKGSDPLAIALLMERTRPEKLVIEAPYPGRGMAQKSLRTFYLRQGHWLTIGMMKRLPYEEVAPATWKKAAVPGIKLRAPREDQIESYIFHIREVLGLPKLTEDECAAVGVGIWYMTERGVELQLQKGGK